MSHAAPAMLTVSMLISRINWLPYRTRRSLIKRLCPAMLRDFTFDTPFFDPAWGMRFHGNTAQLVDRRVYFCGAYEKYLLMMLRDYVNALKRTQTGEVIGVDIGAGAGNHSLFLSKIMDYVHAFEPLDRLRSQCEYNLSLNRIANVALHSEGVSDRNELMPFYAIADQAGTSKDQYHLGDMQLRVGDELLQEHNITQLSLVKIDLGGYEPNALRGLKTSLKSFRPLVALKLSAQTRAALSGAADFASLFPDHYRFYYFASANADRGSYRLAPFSYEETTRRQEVIACPAEKLSCLPI